MTVIVIAWTRHVNVQCNCKLYAYACCKLLSYVVCRFCICDCWSFRNALSVAVFNSLMRSVVWCAGLNVHCVAPELFLLPACVCNVAFESTLSPDICICVCLFSFWCTQINVSIVCGLWATVISSVAVSNDGFVCIGLFGVSVH